MEIRKLESQSVQHLPDAQKDGQVLDLDVLSFQRGPILQAWGTRAREEQLRNIYRHDYNWMVQGAFAGVMKLVASTPWEIKGPDNLTGAQEKFYRQSYKAAAFGRETTTNRPDIEYWQELIRQADFHRGWGSFVQKGVDYLRQDAGWFWEIIGPGNPRSPLTGAVTGLAHLDSLRCIPTGDPEYPVIYVDRLGKLHTMHHTRIVQMLDMPDGDERRPGYGLCALSRAVSIAYREVLMGRFVEASLDDKPKPGFVVATGMNVHKRNEALALYLEDTSSDDPKPWGRTMWFFGMDRDSTPSLDVQAFAEAPEKFDFETYTAKVDVNALALAIGVDPQDLWQLTGGTLGSGTQSAILSQKARGKTVGMLRTSIERALNDILPEEYEFAFKYRDAQEDQERANTAGVWASAVASATNHLSDDEARRILADTVEQFGDVLRDEQGEVRKRDDADVLGQGQDNGDVTRTESDQAGPAGDAGRVDSAGTESDDNRRVGVAVARRSRDLDTASAGTHAKQFQATRLNFEADWSDFVAAAVSGDISKRRARLVGRALLARHGRNALLDGLKEGGVTVDTLNNEDSARLTLWLSEQEGYLSDLLTRIYNDEAKPNPDSTADMWANKSLQEAYYDGLVSARRNLMMEFAGEDGVESCPTCKRLKGQRHRMKDWSRRRLRPGVDTDNFDCGGFHCNHVLVPTTLRAYGRF